MSAVSDLAAIAAVLRETAVEVERMRKTSEQLVNALEGLLIACEHVKWMKHPGDAVTRARAAVAEAYLFRD